MALQLITILVAAFALLVLLLYFAQREHVAGGLFAKTALSSLFVATALAQPHTSQRYFGAVLAALVLCLAGDVLLASPKKHMFLGGLVSFLVGHVSYSVAFLTIVTVTWPGFGGLFVFMVISARVYLWLEPHLGSMKILVIVYIAVITVMTSAASWVLCDSRLPWRGRLLAFFGALLFYVSDMFVARNRFVKRAFFNRLLGLPIYYTGQFMLAFSVGVL